LKRIEPEETDGLDQAQAHLLRFYPMARA